MNQTISLAMAGLLAFCIVTEGLYQLCFKQAAHASTLAEALKKPIVWLGILLWAVEVLAWARVLESVPLTIAFPFMSLSYVSVLLASALFFHERITKRRAFGALLIGAGVACVGATGL